MHDERRAWSLRIDEAQSLDELTALEPSLPPTLVGWLRIKIAARRAELKRDVTKPLAHAFAGSYGLPAPDGRWLYRYRLSDDAFARLEHDLKGRASYAELERGYGSALFVLWASEWFRRTYAGGGVRWSTLAGAIGLPEEQNRLRSITSNGLRLWHREVIRIGGREFLSSLAREGGFPAAAVREGAKGWARDVLVAVVSPLLGEPAAGEERASQLAEAQRARLPLIFHDDEFIQLCADLALAIVVLRREAEPLAKALGFPVVAWLEKYRPDWRDSLPLTTGDRVAEALIDGLMQVEAVSGASVKVDRLLSCGADGKWQEAARITLNGVVDGATMRSVDHSEGRLRAFASGLLARYLPGELALFEPPVEGGHNWEVRPNQRSRGVLPIAFAAPIELDLRAGERRVAHIQLAGGKPRRGLLLVAALEEGTEDRPRLLRILGSGSGQFREPVVFVQAPSGWAFHATEGEAVEQLGTGAGVTVLWRVRGGAVITDDCGDSYRLRCGQPSDATHRIDVVGDVVHWTEATGNFDLYAGPPLLVSPQAGTGLFLRDVGTRQWRPAPNKLPVGNYEIGLRQDRILLDRRQIAVLPKDATFRTSGTGDHVRFELEGFGEVSITPTNDAPVVSLISGEEWRMRPGSIPVHHFVATISWPNKTTLDVIIGFPCPAAIARWDGTLLPGGQHITLDDLRDLVAVHQGEMQLFAELRESRGGKCVEMNWWFDGELPLGSIAADISSLLLPATIDASVRIGMQDGLETYWHIDPFPLTLQKTDDGFVASKGVVDEGVELVGRCFADPAREKIFGSYTLLTQANHRPAHLPDGLCGTWLVYLRSGDRVLSRPAYAPGMGQSEYTKNLLSSAMTLPPGRSLDTALHEVLAMAEGPGLEADTIVLALIELTKSLRGLLPATFRVFSLLCEHPAVLARMAFRAQAEDREAVLALADALPFAWAMIPQRFWQAEMGDAFDRNLSLLGALINAPLYAMEMVVTVRGGLCDKIPLLRTVLEPGDVSKLEEVTQRFVNRAIERIRGSSARRYRMKLGPRLPAYFTGRFDERLLDTLDAPCAAALATKGEWVPDASDIRHIKAMARTHPTYFAEAFATCLKELS